MNLRFRERTLVLLAVTTGLRRSELFALKWKDVDFQSKQIYVIRSIVQNVVGVCMRGRPWSRFCYQEKRKKRELCLGGLLSVYPYCTFVTTGKRRTSGKSLKRNGGDDTDSNSRPLP